MTGSEPPSPRDPTPTTPGRTSPAPQPPPAANRPHVPEGDLTVTGQLVEGVEPGCLLLRSGTTDYLLILPRDVDRGELTAAATVTVRGRLVPGLATTCQQGTPPQVERGPARVRRVVVGYRAVSCR